MFPPIFAISVAILTRLALTSPKKQPASKITPPEPPRQPTPLRLVWSSTSASEPLDVGQRRLDPQGLTGGHMSYEGYYLLYDGTVLARVNPGHTAHIFREREGVWHPADHVIHKVTGFGGDTDFDKTTEAQARLRFPKAFLG